MVGCYRLGLQIFINEEEFVVRLSVNTKSFAENLGSRDREGHECFLNPFNGGSGARAGGRGGGDIAEKVTSAIMWSMSAASPLRQQDMLIDVRCL